MSREIKARGIFFIGFYQPSVKHCRVFVTASHVKIALTNRTLVKFRPSPYPNYEELEVKKMTIIWSGTLAILLSRFRRKLFRVDKIRYSVEDQIKRIGVYYMCIDDLPI